MTDYDPEIIRMLQQVNINLRACLLILRHMQAIYQDEVAERSGYQSPSTNFWMAETKNEATK